MPRSFAVDHVLAPFTQRGTSGALAHPGRHAAVAIVLAEHDGEAEALFIRRAEHPSDPWSGHMAFPGGRHDETDQGLLHTALRETREEVGLDLEAHGRVVARLDDVQAVARGRRVGLTIAPFVFALSRARPELTASDEVAEALWIPLRTLAEGEGRGTMPYKHEGVVLELPCIRHEGRTIWGLTYQMLTAFLDELAAHRR